MKAITTIFTVVTLAAAVIGCDGQGQYFDEDAGALMTFGDDALGQTPGKCSYESDKKLNAKGSATHWQSKRQEWGEGSKSYHETMAGLRKRAGETCGEDLSNKVDDFVAACALKCYSKGCGASVEPKDKRLTCEVDEEPKVTATARYWRYDIHSRGSINASCRCKDYAEQEQAEATPSQY